MSKTTIFMPLPVKLPWSFEKALGYPRGFRWVAFFWEPCGDEVIFDDGFCSADGNPWGFLQFTSHPKIKPWLNGYNIGSSEDAATHWILCDLQDREIFVGERKETRAFLLDEVRKYAPHITKPVTPIEISPEKFEELLKNIRENMSRTPVPSAEEIMEKMRRDKEAVEEMISELGKI